MSKLSRLAAGSALLAAVAMGGADAALADGYKAKKVAYERPADWSGVYFGVSSGYQWSSLDFAYLNPVFPSTSNPDSADGLVGAHIGIQHQFGSVVLGIEGGWASSFRDDMGSDACHPAANCVAGTRVTARLNDILSVGARIGLASGHWMPYLTGGYASGNFHYRGDTAAGVLFSQDTTRHDGWYLGAGFDYVISPGWTAGLEYRHYDFGDATTIPFDATGVPRPQEIYRLDPSVDAITARVSWRWGRPDMPAPLK